MIVTVTQMEATTLRNLNNLLRAVVDFPITAQILDRSTVIDIKSANCTNREI